MTFTVKSGVILTEVHPAMVAAWPTIMQVLRRHGLNTTLTSGRDGTHMEGSYHYHWPLQACDFRTWDPDEPPGTQLSQERKEAIAEDLRRELGEPFQVVVERTHLHVEFDERKT
jgi:hypothetical protein